MPFGGRECRPPIRFGKIDPSLKTGTTSWGNPPIVLYRHMVKPKTSATVLVAGTKGEPLLVGGSYGKGNVVVFTGTVLGDVPKGQHAFWDSPSWPDILGASIRWSQQK